MGSILANWQQKIKEKLCKLYFVINGYKKAESLPIHAYIEYSFTIRSQMVETQYQRVKKLNHLIENNNINLKNKKGNTALNCAIMNYDQIALEALLNQHDVDVNIINHEGLNSLMLAANYHLLLDQKVTPKQIGLLEVLINKTQFNHFYQKKSINYLPVILDQIIYQLEERSQPLHSVLHLLLSKIDFSIEDNQLVFPKYKNKHSQPTSMKVIKLCQIYLEKKELENKILASSNFSYESTSSNAKDIESVKLNSINIENDQSILNKKQRKKI